jgi:hypothetical protein
MKSKVLISIILILVLKAGYSQTSEQNSAGIGSAATGTVTLAQFNVQSSTTYATSLEWKTMMEMKVAYYTVQRGTDGINFNNLAQVNSKMTDSTHEYQLDYTYTDNSPLAGKSYYRLMIVYRNGISTYSDIITAINNASQGLKIYPTVVQNSSLFVETDKQIKNVRLEVFDLSGKKISETAWDTLDGRQSLQIVANSSMIKTGTYFARLSSKGETILSQLLIIQSR